MTTPDLVIRAGTTATGPWRLSISPERAGWSYSGLHVLTLPGGGSEPIRFESDESLLIPLAGSFEVDLDGEPVRLAGRTDVFAGPSDHVYLPPGVSAVVSSSSSGGRLAVATARTDPTDAERRPAQYVAATGARVEERGGGASSRTVVNYTIDTGLRTQRLLVCEVITPGGMWSSYPPHKHDTHSDTERELEEIYYVEVAGDDGFGFYRGYSSSPDRPLDLVTTVRDGDTVLVPHGYHGPVAALPGYDLYYLNVMSGPAADGRWLAVDDPRYTWVRETWSEA